MEAAMNEQKKVRVFVTVYNDQEDVKTDDGYRPISLGHREWASLLREMRIIIEQYEITGYKLTGVMEWHSGPYDTEQSACWSITVEESRVEALRDRLFKLVTNRPYLLPNGPAVLKAETV
jgi:hypothetical protein